VDPFGHGGTFPYILKSAGDSMSGCLIYLCNNLFVWHNFGRKYFFKGGPGWGANPGSFDFVYFLIPLLYR
jgi:hypothetical protein